MNVQIKPIPSHLDPLLAGLWDREVVWVSGATGSWGREICRQLLLLDVAKVVCFCRGEHRAADLYESLADDRVRLRLGDIRDSQRVHESLGDSTVVIHAAAMKRIDSVSHNLFEMHDVNVNGTKSVIDGVLSYDRDIEQAFYISSDKAVEATTFYGATKFTAEQMWLYGNELSPSPAPPWFGAARFGNAIGSTGSVLRIWEQQIKEGKPLTVTQPFSTRYLITLPQAVRFLLATMSDMDVGGLWAPEMPAAYLSDVVEAFAPGYPKIVTGTSRGFGEKKHETIDGLSSSRYPTTRFLSVAEIRQLLEDGGISCHVS